MGRLPCAATKKDGTPCKGGAMRGSKFCGAHKNATVAPVEAPPAAQAPPVIKKWHDTPPRTFGPFDTPRGVTVRFENGRWWEPG
jgi:hypothetical protein